MVIRNGGGARHYLRFPPHSGQAVRHFLQKPTPISRVTRLVGVCHLERIDVYDHTEYIEYVRTRDPDDTAEVNAMLNHLDRFAKSGGTEGVDDFLQGIILGDLELAVGHADDVNRKYLALYVRYCFNQLPGELVLLLRPLSLVLRDRLGDSKHPLTKTDVQQAAEEFDGILGAVRDER